MTHRTIGAVALAMLVVAPLHASTADNGTTQALRKKAPVGLTESFYHCVSDAASDKNRLSGCIDTEKEVQDGRLNKAYKALTARLDQPSRNSLRTAERAWLDYNDKSVALQTSLGRSSPINDLDVATSELFRYCVQANELEHYLFGLGD